MKKLLILTLILVVAVALTACDGSVTDDGFYEGETNANGEFHGYGIWVYRNFRYEGYFADGVPNGEGVLSQAKPIPNDRKDDLDYAVKVITQGTFIDGFAHGTVWHTWYMEDGAVHTWIIDVDMGYLTAANKDIYADDGKTKLPVDADYLIAVPPFVKDVRTFANTPAPLSSGSFSAGPGPGISSGAVTSDTDNTPPSPDKPPPDTPPPDTPPPKTPPPAGTADTANITIGKSTFAPGESFTISVFGITQDMVNDLAFIGAYEAGDRHENYLHYIYVEAGESIVDAIAPPVAGDFEFRLFSWDFDYFGDSEGAFIISIPFKVE